MSFPDAALFARSLHLDGLLTFASSGGHDPRVATFERSVGGENFIRFCAAHRLGTSILIAQTVEPLGRMPQPGDIASSLHIGIHLRGGLHAAQAVLTDLPEPTILLSAGNDVFAVWRLKEALSGKPLFALCDTVAAKASGRVALFVPLPGTLRGGIRVKQEHFKKHLTYSAKELEGAREPRLALLDADRIQSVPMEWLWPNMIPLGSLTLLGGMGGMGKSQMACDIASRVSTGAPWPGGELGTKGEVIVLEAEDDLKKTVRPRLEACGANMSRIRLGKVTELSRSIGGLVTLIEERDGAPLVILSPLRKFFSAVDLAGDIAVRDALQPLIDYAEQKRIAFLGIMHPPKDKEHKEAFGGSAAYFNLARAALSCIPDPEDKEKIIKRKRRIIVSAKSNLGPDDGAMGYRIKPVTLPSGIETSRIEWLGRREVMQTEMLALASPASAREMAKAWLRGYLSGRTVPVAEIEAAAEAAGHSRTTLHRARGEMNVVIVRGEFQGPSTWRLA